MEQLCLPCTCVNVCVRLCLCGVEGGGVCITALSRSKDASLSALGGNIVLQPETEVVSSRLVVVSDVERCRVLQLPGTL